MPKNFNFGASVKLKRPTAEEPKNLDKLEEKQIDIASEINVGTIQEAVNNESQVGEVILSNSKPAPEPKPEQQTKEETRLNGFRLPIGLDHLLESYAYHEGVNKTDVVIDALKQFF